VVSGWGEGSVTSVAAASSAESTPLPKPPTQKKGIGRYSRVPAPIQRGPRLDRTAPRALRAGLAEDTGMFNGSGRVRRRGEEVASYLFHAYGTNLQFGEGEFNFVKTRAQHGTKEAFRLRDEHFHVPEPQTP
jgi:hypothetical protein